MSDIYISAMDEIKEDIEKINKRLSDLAKEYIAKRKPKTVWDLKDGDESYTLHGDGEAVECGKGSLRNGYRYNGNLFLTKGEAKKESTRRRVEAKVIKRIAELNDGWVPNWKGGGTSSKCCIFYKPEESCLGAGWHYTVKYLRDCFYLKTIALGNQLIKEMPDELKTMLGVE